MKIRCCACGKAISSELPKGSILRGVAECPECVEEAVKKNPCLQVDADLHIDWEGRFMRLASQQRVVLLAIATERDKQDTKWGDQKHGVYTWLAILGEEVGEANKAARHTEFGGEEAGGLREELIQLAAVAVKMVENIDRGLL